MAQGNIVIENMEVDFTYTWVDDENGEHMEDIYVEELKIIDKSLPVGEDLYQLAKLVTPTTKVVDGKVVSILAKDYRTAIMATIEGINGIFPILDDNGEIDFKVTDLKAVGVSIGDMLIKYIEENHEHPYE